MLAVLPEIHSPLGCGCEWGSESRLCVGSPACEVRGRVGEAVFDIGGGHNEVTIPNLLRHYRYVDRRYTPQRPHTKNLITPRDHGLTRCLRCPVAPIWWEMPSTSPFR